MLFNLLVRTAEFVWGCLKSPDGQSLLSEWEQFVETGEYTVPADTAQTFQQSVPTQQRKDVPSDTGVTS